MDIELRGELERPVAEVDLDELMRCLGWRNGGRSGDYMVYEPRVEGWLIPGVRIYVKSRRGEEGLWIYEGFGTGLGSRLEFVLYVGGREWRFCGRQSGLVNLLGMGLCGGDGEGAYKKDFRLSQTIIHRSRINFLSLTKGVQHL